MTDKIASVPKETVAELLYYLAENERFSSVTANLKGDFSVPQVRNLLREVASTINEEAQDESVATDRVRVGAELSPKAREVLASLTPEEESKLLSAFGLIPK